MAVKNLSEARNLGDLSENGLYTAAKARLRSIDSQIFRTEIQIKLADVKEGRNKASIDIGSKVIVAGINKTHTFRIVGDFESDPKNGKISQHSPLGKVLMRKKEGDTVIFKAPKGEITYKILEVC